MLFDSRSILIRVEYDFRGGRKSKQFVDHYEARRFYVYKSNLGKNPRVFRVGNLPESTPLSAEKKGEKMKRSSKAGSTSPKNSGRRATNPKRSNSTQGVQQSKPSSSSRSQDGELPEPLVTKPQRVNATTKSRAFFAGQVLKKHGLEQGVTDEMIQEVDNLYGTPNQNESWARLVGAWHAIRGFQDQH